MKDTPQEATRQVLMNIAGEHLHDVKTTHPTKNTLGAAIVAASLASTFVKEPPRYNKVWYHPIFGRAWNRRSKILTTEEQQRKEVASLEAIAKAKAKRERKAMNRTISTNQQTAKGL